MLDLLCVKELLLFVSSEPLPVRSVQISDYRESPETGVVFEIDPPAGNVFSRVNISYTEGQERRSMLYKGEVWTLRLWSWTSEAVIWRLPSVSRLSQISTKERRCSSTGYRGCVTATSPSSWSLRPPCTRPPWSHTVTSHTHLYTTGQVRKQQQQQKNWKSTFSEILFSSLWRYRWWWWWCSLIRWGWGDPVTVNASSAAVSVVCVASIIQIRLSRRFLLWDLIVFIILCWEADI